MSTLNLFQFSGRLSQDGLKTSRRLKRSAHNLLLLLDPELLGDQRAETPAKLQCPADIEPSRPTIQHTVLSIEGALPFLTLASPPPLRHLRHPAAFLCDRPGMPCLATCLEGVLGG